MGHILVYVFVKELSLEICSKVIQPSNIVYVKLL